MRPVVSVVVSALVLAACGGESGRAGDPYALDGGGTDGGLDDGGTFDGGLDGTGGMADGSGGDGMPGDTGDPTDGGPMFDCSPAWTTPWIGSPCDADSDCSYTGGFCITEGGDGWPCGTCSQDCEQFCPDEPGTPTTYCVDGDELGLTAGGHCLSQCDPALLGGNGCRDGYACVPMNRYMDPSSSAGVCVPDDGSAGGDTDCQQTLVDMGAVFVPVDHTPDSPDGHPELICEIDEPVLLYSPINGVALRYVSDTEEGPVFLGCDAAVSVVGSAAVAATLGAVEMLHIGTYNCRVIAGTSTISEHGKANAIDIAGFTLTDGSEVTVLDDWEDGNPNPVTEYGQLLREFTDQIWAMGLWNIILTPEYNADHDNHFHVDLKAGGNTYE